VLIVKQDFQQSSSEPIRSKNQTELFNYDNPIGLSAGFDKDGELTDAYPLTGFGLFGVGF
jgi:dihydroorotate dehydrogenase